LARRLWVPKFGVSAAFLEHELELNEVFTALWAPERKGTWAQPQNPVFRWAPAGSLEASRLAWLAAGARGPRERKLAPDAVLDWLPARRRFFLEMERGTHPVASGDPDRAGATMHKVERYRGYFLARAGAGSPETAYGKAYPDSFAPEVWFLEPTRVRAESINEAIGKAFRGRPELPCRIRALTREAAIRELGKGKDKETAEEAHPAASLQVSEGERTKLEGLYRALCAKGEKMEGLEEMYAVLKRARGTRN
jgi:hypothetical protein